MCCGFEIFVKITGVLMQRGPQGAVQVLLTLDLNFSYTPEDHGPKNCLWPEQSGCSSLVPPPPASPSRPLAAPRLYHRCSNCMFERAGSFCPLLSSNPQHIHILSHSPHFPNAARLPCVAAPRPTAGGGKGRLPKSASRDWRAKCMVRRLACFPVFRMTSS